MTVVEMVEKEPSLSSRICPNYPQIMAEVPYCVLNEMAVSLEDILSRRMRLGIVNQKECLEAAPKVAMLVQSLLGLGQCSNRDGTLITRAHFEGSDAVVSNPRNSGR